MASSFIQMSYRKLFINDDEIEKNNNHHHYDDNTDFSTETSRVTKKQWPIYIKLFFFNFISFGFHHKYLYVLKRSKRKKYSYIISSKIESNEKKEQKKHFKKLQQLNQPLITTETYKHIHKNETTQHNNENLFFSNNQPKIQPQKIL